MDQQREKKLIDISFRVSLILKAINAGVEILLGLVVVFITQDFILSVTHFLIHDELTENPENVILKYAYQIAQHFSFSGKIFLVFYLLSHGLIKIFLVVALWKKKMWAYPLSLVVLSLFIFYQIYKYIFTHSMWILLLTLFDLFVMWLIWKEYSLQVKHK